jgi:hypothetical protein
LAEYDLETRIAELFHGIELSFAKGNKDEMLWNSIVERYHYLGHRVIVGRCIKYILRSGPSVLGAIAFSSPAWKIKARDDLLLRMNISTEDINDKVICNSRFVLLPNASAYNLASRALSLATKSVAMDWERYYAVRPLVVETFVEGDRFGGICYRAANWHYIGDTAGYAKNGRGHHNGQPSKMIFVYGLGRRARRSLAAAILESRSNMPEADYESR